MNMLEVRPGWCVSSVCWPEQRGIEDSFQPHTAQPIAQHSQTRAQRITAPLSYQVGHRNSLVHGRDILDRKEKVEIHMPQSPDLCILDCISKVTASIASWSQPVATYITQCSVLTGGRTHTVLAQLVGSEPALQGCKARKTGRDV